MGGTRRQRAATHTNKARGRAWRPPSWMPPDTVGLPAVTRTTTPRLIYAHVEPDLDPFPGAVAVAAVRMHGAAGKLRPVVLVEERRGGAAWTAWCLTSQAVYASGEPRAEAVGSEQVGLRCGYVWGRYHEVSADEIEGVVWAAPLELLLACAFMEGAADIDGQRRRVERIHSEHLAAGWYWPKPR